MSGKIMPCFFGHNRQVIDEPQFALVGRVRQCVNAKIDCGQTGASFWRKSYFALYFDS
jgi:hypothetical protein